MIRINPIHLQAVDIPDAWFQVISNLLEYGFKYKIQYGSFIGQTRLEFDWCSILIKKPYTEPYDLMLPEIPSHLNIPNPVEKGYVEQYLPYLMTATIKKEESYCYGSRLAGQYQDFKTGIYANQIAYWCEILKESPNTNQAILQVGAPEDMFLDDPACLRHIDMRVKEDHLIFYPYFRSWDAWGGFPANLAGIAVLQKYMADEIGVKVGPILAASKGLHIYGYVEELAKIRRGKIND